MNTNLYDRFNNNLSISWLKLYNYRCMNHLSIDFHHRLTVLVANNGQGKTAVMDAIASAFGPFVGAFDEGKDRPFQSNDIRIQMHGYSNRSEFVDGGLTLEAGGNVKFEPASWRRQKVGLKSVSTIKDARILSDYARVLQSSVRREIHEPVSGTCLPLVVYYPTDRLWSSHRQPNKKISRTSRTIGYKDCLKSGPNFKLMSDWFRYWSINSLNQRYKADLMHGSSNLAEFDNSLEVIRDAINLCLAPSGWCDLHYNMEQEELIAYHPDHGLLPIAMLSDGIRSMLMLVADIAFRMVKLNPNLGTFAAKETSGVVLIDEIDMHLHPAWQQTVLTSLLKAFPKVQFIVTTHSPQVLSSVPAECIRVFENGTVHSSPAGTEGAESSRILKRVFSVNPRPIENEVSKSLKLYLALVDQDKWSSEQALVLRKYLDEAFKGEEPALQEADLIIENRKWELDQ